MTDPKPISKFLLVPELPFTPRYTEEEDQWASSEWGNKRKKVLWELPNWRLFVSAALAFQLVKQRHELTPPGNTSLESLLSCYYFISKLPHLCTQISARYVTCVRNDAGQRPRPCPGVQLIGTMPSEDLEVDIICLCYFTLILDGWVEAFPIPTKRTREVVRALLKEIIPRYGLPLFIGSDNGLLCLKLSRLYPKL